MEVSLVLVVATVKVVSQQNVAWMLPFGEPPMGLHPLNFPISGGRLTAIRRVDRPNRRVPNPGAASSRSPVSL